MDTNKCDTIELTQQDFPFGRLLKFWRSVHELSQEGLALGLGSSPRHISFLENGKARPSKDMVYKLASQLSLNKRDTTHLLVSAGYSEGLKVIDFHSESPKWLRNAMKLTLRAMDPYPATLMDNTGKILMVNKSWVSFFSLSVDKKTLDFVTNHFDFIFNPKAAGNIIGSRQDTLSVILMSLTQAGILNDDQSALDEVKRLAAHPDVPKNWRQRGAEIEPMASYRVQIHIDGVLRHFYNVTQTVSSGGSIAYAAEPRITINTLYPEDDTYDLSGLLNPEATHPLLFY